MDSGEFAIFENNSTARQQRIEDVMRAILPGIDAHNKKKKAATVAYALLALTFVFVVGYNIGHQFRPVSYSEKMIIESLIRDTSRSLKKSPQEVTNHLLKELGVEKIKNIKSAQMDDALHILGQYID